MTFYMHHHCLLLSPYPFGGKGIAIEGLEADYVINEPDRVIEDPFGNDEDDG